MTTMRPDVSTRVRALGFAACVAMGGCALSGPDTPPPVAALPERYPDAGASATTRAASLAWRDFFREPALATLIGDALAGNHDLRLAVLRVEEARAAWGIQRADRLPTIAVSASDNRARVPGDVNLTGRPLLTDQYGFGVGLSSWEIDLWGRVRSLSEAALAEFLATDAGRRAATLSLVAQVANAWLGLVEIDERLGIARRTVDTRAESLRIHRRRAELGATSRLELAQVELLWRQAGALVLQLEQARAAQSNAIGLLVGRPLAPAEGAPRDATAPFREIGAGAPSDLLLDRPDIVAAEHALAATRANVAAARAAFFPRIALTGSFGNASAALDGLFDTGSRAWTFAPVVTLPILDGGRRDAALALAQVRREQAVVRYERAIQAAFRDVADALAARRWLGEQLAVARETLAVQAERARLARLRYESGAARFLEVLDAERDLLALQQQLVQTRRAWLAAQVALYAALGGGSRTLPDTPADTRTPGSLPRP